MSISNSRFRGSLAKCYDYLTNKGKKEKNTYGVFIWSVEDKILKAQKRGLLLENPTATHAQDPPNVSSPSINSDSVQDVTENQLPGVSHIQSAATLLEPVSRDLAAVLVDPVLLWKHFFSGIMDGTTDAVEDNVQEHREVYCNSLEVTQAKRRGELRFSYVCHLPLKLNLTPLKRGRSIANTFVSIIEMRFGPLHASLQVGDVILEWNDSSLVTPYLCAYEDQVVQLDMQPHSKWVDYTAEHHSTMRKAAQELDFPKQIDLTYQIASKKKDLIDALIEVIVKYNTRFYYNIINRNCQHFVLDALEALQVSIPKELSGSLGEYYNDLVKGRTPSLPHKFKSHSDLDEYVMREVTITDMLQHDLEFILALYFRFHLESKSELTDCKALDEWQCKESHCRMGEVEKHIEIKSMKIHNFQVAR